MVLLLALFFGIYANHDYISFNIGLVSLLLIASFSMGIQFVCAKHVNRSDVATTIITATVSNLVSKVVSQSQPTSAGMNNTGGSVNVAERVGHKWLVG